MQEPRDPVESASDGSRDLYGIATWERRTMLDGFSAWLYGALKSLARGLVIVVAGAILVLQIVFGGLASVTNPVIGVFLLLSIVPALFFAVYVWRVDVGNREPLGLLVFTFLLGILFAGFAAIINTVAQSWFVAIPVVGMALFFYLIVAPIEETVKWLAVRLYAYRSDEFNAVIDGAVYGAMAGLGFATIENAIYIGQQYVNALAQAGGSGAFGAALGTAAVRTFAGPGHVIYSAFAGYYLGLAKFNRESAGPIVVKGLLIAAFIHATYNTLVSIVPGLLGAFAGVPGGLGFLGFVVVYDGIFGYALYRKIARYRRAFEETDAAGNDGTGDAGEDPDGAEAADPEDASGGTGIAEPGDSVAERPDDAEGLPGEERPDDAERSEDADGAEGSDDDTVTAPDGTPSPSDDPSAGEDDPDEWDWGR